jgi:hypothetical protein
MLRAPYCRGVKIFSAAVVAEKRRRTHSFSLFSANVRAFANVKKIPPRALLIPTYVKDVGV